MKVKCPRCGVEGYLFSEKKRLASGDVQVYYYVLHYLYDPQTKKRKYWKHHVGAEVYRYVTRTHIQLSAGVRIPLSYPTLYTLLKYSRDSIESALNIFRRSVRERKGGENGQVDVDEVRRRLGELKKLISLFEDELNKLNSRS